MPRARASRWPLQPWGDGIDVGAACYANLMQALSNRVYVPPPAGDNIVVLNATWADYQRMLEQRGDHSAPRFAYSDGRVEIMSPSEDHEAIKSTIGTLVEVWCMEHGIEFRTLGSWTLENKRAARAIEPDECYVLSDNQAATKPDLAIEVVWTSGGLNKLDIFCALGVPEVWFWRRGVISVHVLRDGEYVEQLTSQVLPGLDVATLATFINEPTTSQSIRKYRASLAGG
jgi:Uma2 family endonuclease